MKRLILIFLLFNLFSCAVSPFDNKNDAEIAKVHFTFNGLKKAYLDTSKNGVSVEVLFHDVHLDKRDSIKFYVVPVDTNFTQLNGLQRINMDFSADTLAKKEMWFSTHGMELPASFMYEIGAVYMSGPFEEENMQWELDTVVNDFFTFNVYDQPKEYQQVVDKYGLEPTVFKRE